MPHKVNPIDFENAEGNLGMANAILEHLAVKLPVSRLQRDLTDSTVLRNVGMPFGHIIIAIQSSLKGLRKLLLNEPAIYRDLDNCWSVVAEAIQTILRREAYPHPYEALKALTRTNQAITEASIKEFIEGLNVSEEIKKELRVITPPYLYGNLSNHRSVPEEFQLFTPAIVIETYKIQGIIETMNGREASRFNFIRIKNNEYRKRNLA